MAENVWFLRKLPIFSQLGDDSEVSVVSNGIGRDIAAGTLVNASRQSRREVFVVMRGQLEVLSYLADGRRVIVNTLEAGDYWGWLESPDAGEATDAGLTLRAVTDVNLVAFTRDYFERLLAKRPSVAIEVTRMLGLRTRRYEVRLANLLFQTSRQKLASLLLDPTQAEPGEGIALSHEQLGGLIGLSREQVTRILGEFECSGHVRSRRRNIQVLDRAGLQREREKG